MPPPELAPLAPFSAQLREVLKPVKETPLTLKFQNSGGLADLLGGVIGFGLPILMWIAASVWFILIFFIRSRLGLTLAVSVTMFSYLLTQYRRERFAFWWFNQATKYYPNLEMTFEPGVIDEPLMKDRLATLVNDLQSRCQRNVRLVQESPLGESAVPAGEMSVLTDALTAPPTTPGDPKRPRLYAFHPHGIFCISWSFVYMSGLLREVYFLMASALHMAPILKLWTKLVGLTAPVNKSSMTQLMSSQTSVGLLPGGFQEATLHDFGVHKVYIKNRRGFIKLALRYGYDIVPVFSYGDAYTYANPMFSMSVRLWLNRFSIPSVFPWGLSWLPFAPRQTPFFRIILGTPLRMPHIPNPTDAQVVHHHEIYMREVKRIFYQHRERSGDPRDSGAKLHVL